MQDELFFEESGKGDVTIVLLHYFGGSSRTWKPVVESLKEKFRCIAIDLPGFGSSAPLSSPATVENVAEKVSALMQGLGLNNVALVGHSMGGKIAAQLAAMPSLKIAQLILVAPSPPTPEPMKPQKRKELMDAFGDRKALEKDAKGLVAEPLSDSVLKEIVDDNLRIAQTAWNDWINVGSKEDISTEVKNILIPVTVITGEKDPNFSTSFLQEEIGAYLPQATFTELKNAGHLLPVEAPAFLVQIIAGAVA